MGKSVLITGGAGFIGANFVRIALEQSDIERIVVLDKLTYAGSLDNLAGILDDSRVKFIRGDIADANTAHAAMTDMDWVVNFAAESHVDRSLSDASPFIRTNIEGVRIMLEIATETKPARFVQISTDEVYGSLAEGASDENAPLRPSSPYSASKAAADMLCNAFATSFDVPVIIARSSNNYGPYQYPEKLIPRFVALAMQDSPLPLYGDGKYMRDWLHVADNCRAILMLLREGKIGEIYNIGASELHENIEIAAILLQLLGKPEQLISHVADRLGHDRRYCVNWEKIAALGWRPLAKFGDEFAATIQWYRDRSAWLQTKSREAEKFYGAQAE